MWIAVIMGLNQPDPKEGTETLPRAGVVSAAGGLNQPDPKEGTETRHA